MTDETAALARPVRDRMSSRLRHARALPYVGRRLLHAVVVVWAAYTITFVLLYLLPSDPVTLMLQGQGDSASVDPEVLAAMNEKYGFDRPVVAQYLGLLTAAVRGDFGTSITDGRDVLVRITEVLPHTTRLAFTGLVLGILLGIVVAILANLTRRNGLKQLLFSYAPFVASIPAFLLGLFLIQLFSYQLGWLPAAGNKGISGLILPAVAVAIQVSADIAQVTAKALHDNLHAPYSQYLLAKGLGRRAILLRHSLRNAVIPAVTLIGLSVGGVLGGAIITETVFSRQGLGRLLEEAVTLQDIPVVQAVVVFTAILFAVTNLVIDLLYPLINPRVSVR